jgi:hypothetical protein
MRWYVLAVLSAAVAVGTGCFGAWQIAQAHSIDHAPVRVAGTVVRIPTGVATYNQVDYRVHGRREEAANLALPSGSGIGDRVCLEVSGGELTAARPCGQQYPHAVGVSLARVLGPLGALVAVLALLRVHQLRRALQAAGPRPGRRRRR